MTEIYNTKTELPKKNIETLPGVLPAQAGGHPGESSPCLFSNNSIEKTQTSSTSPEKPLKNLLSSYHKKQAQTLFENVERLVKKESASINHVAFLTLTFQDNVTDPKEAYRRFRSFNTNFLAPHPVYGEWVNTKEHQVRGAWHFHMIISLSQDIKTGFDFDIYEEWLKGPRKPGTFPTGSKELRQLWAELAVALEKYNFGRIFTLEPIKSNEEALARYVGKYISKHIGQREEKDKGVRLVNYSKNWVKNSVKRAWNNENSKEWREKLKVFANYHGTDSMYQLSEILGPGWAYKYQHEIIDISMVEVHLEKKQPREISYESPELKRIYANFEIAEMEINTENTKSKSRTKSRDKSRKKIKTQSIIPRAKNIPQGLTETIKDQVKQGRIENPCIEAKTHKDQWERKKQGLEILAAQEGYIKPEDKTGVPF